MLQVVLLLLLLCTSTDQRTRGYILQRTGSMSEAWACCVEPCGWVCCEALLGLLTLRIRPPSSVLSSTVPSIVYVYNISWLLQSAGERDTRFLLPRPATTAGSRFNSTPALLSCKSRLILRSMYVQPTMTTRWTKAVLLCTTLNLHTYGSGRETRRYTPFKVCWLRQHHSSTHLILLSLLVLRVPYIDYLVLNRKKVVSQAGCLRIICTKYILRSPYFLYVLGWVNLFTESVSR